MGKSGKGLGIFSLLIAIVALGLGLYQIFFSSPPEGPKIYSDTNNDIVYLSISGSEYVPNLNVTYTTKAGDSVLFEFSCQVSVEITGYSTTVDISFDIDGLPPSPNTPISVTAISPDPYLHIPFMMRYYIQSSSAGTHVLRIQTNIDDGGTTSFVRYCVLTATVY